MALKPIDENHALQIQAGTLGRKAGHQFEDEITKQINALPKPFTPTPIAGHVRTGNPAKQLVNYVANRMNYPIVDRVTAISTGALATSEEGKKFLSVNGAQISRCKSDLLLTLHGGGKESTIGVSTKQCNNKTPTNAQLYFTTARGFATLLKNNGFCISDVAIEALRQFCGDSGFRPTDNPKLYASRKTDNRRFFWEEIDANGRNEWETLFSDKQDEISRLLFQKAYLDDPFVPDFLLHKTKQSLSWDSTEIALYTIDEIVALSRAYRGFETRPYSVKKGSFRDPAGITHLAPRFGVIQMQRGGQKQHPEQLQFNLEAGYFYKI